MTQIPSVHPEVWDDVNDVIGYYNDLADGLAEGFLDEFDAALSFMGAYPLAARVFHSKYRRVALRRFPYVVCYRVVGDLVRVLAVFHDKRDPAWIDAILTARA